LVSVEIKSVWKVWGQRELVQMALVVPRKWVPKVWGQRDSVQTVLVLMVLACPWTWMVCVCALTS
jgi:hypothetical protein